MSVILQITIISLISCGFTQLIKNYIVGKNKLLIYGFNFLVCLLLEVLLNVSIYGVLLFNIVSISQIFLYAFIELIISNLMYDKLKDLFKTKEVKKDTEITNNEVQIGKVRYSKVIIIFMLLFTFIFTLIVMALIYLKQTESQMIINMYQNYLHLVEIELGFMAGMSITDKIVNKGE